MADAFDQTLSQVAAPRGAQSFGRFRPVTPKAEAGGLGLAFDIGKTVFAGALTLKEEAGDNALKEEINEGIETEVLKLNKLKAAGGQTGNGTQAFNLNLMAIAKKLRADGHDSAKINEIFRDNGFLPPQAAVFNELRDTENAQEAAQEKRIEGLITEAHIAGIALLNPDGSIDRTGTVELMQQGARAEASQRTTLAGLGLIALPSGELKPVIRQQYFAKRPSKPVTRCLVSKPRSTLA